MGPPRGPGPGQPGSLSRSGSQALNLTFGQLEEQLGSAKSVGQMTLEEFLDSLGEIDLRLMSADGSTATPAAPTPKAPQRQPSLGKRRSLMRTNTLEKYGSQTVHDVFRQFSGINSALTTGDDILPEGLTIGSYLATANIDYVPPALGIPPARLPSFNGAEAGPSHSGRKGGRGRGRGAGPTPLSRSTAPAAVQLPSPAALEHAAVVPLPESQKSQQVRSAQRAARQRMRERAQSKRAAPESDSGHERTDVDRQAKAMERARKNRESAAKSRMMKQAYTESLEQQVADLKAQNALLRKQIAESTLVTSTPPAAPPAVETTKVAQPGPGNLRRTRSTPEAAMSKATLGSSKRPRTDDNEGSRRSQRRKTVIPAP